MMTYEMVGLADENGREYECIYGTYTKEKGFMFNDSINHIVIEDGWRGFINILFHDNLWKLKQEPVKEVTLEDIEREFGCKVRIVDPAAKEEEYRALSQEEKDNINKEIAFFKKWFGIDIDPEEYY